MELRDKIKALLLPLGLISSGCYNTTVPQFSENIKRAKINNTFVKEYLYDTTHTSPPVNIGEVWVEKVWYYEAFGNKTIEDGETLYIQYIANKQFKIKDYWNIFLREDTTTSTLLFETYSGHKSIGDDRIWFELDFRKGITLPDTIRFNIYDKRKSDTSKIGELVLVAKPE